MSAPELERVRVARTERARDIARYSCGWRIPLSLYVVCGQAGVCVGLVCATRLFLSPIGSKRPTALSRRVEIPVSMTRLSQ